MSEPSEPSRTPTSSSVTQDETPALQRTKSSIDASSLQQKASSTSLQSDDQASKDAAVTCRIYLAAAVGALSLAILIASAFTLASPAAKYQQEDEEGDTTLRVYRVNMEPREATKQGTATRGAVHNATASPTQRTTPDSAEMETIAKIDLSDFPRKKRGRPSLTKSTRKRMTVPEASEAPPSDDDVPPETEATGSGHDGVSRPEARFATDATVAPAENITTTASRVSMVDRRGRPRGGSGARGKPKRLPVPAVGAGPRKPTASTPRSKRIPIKDGSPGHTAKSPKVGTPSPPAVAGKPPPAATTIKPSHPGVARKAPFPAVAGKRSQTATAGTPPPRAKAGKPARPPAIAGELPIPVSTQRPGHDGDQTKAVRPAAKPEPKPGATTKADASGLGSSSVSSGGSGAAGGHHVVSPEEKPETEVKRADEDDEENEDDDDGMSFEERIVPPRISGRGDDEAGDHGVEHVGPGHQTARQPTSPPTGEKAHRNAADVTPGAETTSSAEKGETSGDYDDDRPGIVGGLKKEQPLHWDKRKALLLCTVGSTLTDEAVYPLKEQLCDHYVFTHVTVLGSELGTNYGISAYMTFRKMAQENEHRGRVRFGVSLSPAYVESQPEYRPALGGMMQRLADEYAVDSFGVIGLTVSHMGLRPGLPATNWIAGMSNSMDRLPARNHLFVGLVLAAHYPSLRLDSVRQRTLAETLRSQTEALRVDTLVLITHLWDAASLQRSESCLTQPPSLWMREASSDDTSKPTTPDLETSAHILGFFKSNVTRTFLSMTMAVMRYRVEESGSQSSHVMGVPCVEGHPTSFAVTCSSVLRQGTRGGFDGRSLTPWFAKKGAVFTYEDRSSIAAKMKGCLHALRSLGQLRTGWALFDIEQELLRAEDCDLELVRPAAHGRIRAVRAILDALGRAANPHARRRRRRR
ncbi:nucleolar protein dao-5-like [Dermacentor albipictus]|uniref:nucleolar protein dao-5-like n=1 Tax=Dermacentor albipictus TaxID=60249 RepID=UPI0038FCD8FC